jgi:hypothetical protein
MAVIKYRKYFVDSTLRQDEVLGFLGTKEFVGLLEVASSVFGVCRSQIDGSGASQILQPMRGEGTGRRR